MAVLWICRHDTPGIQKNVFAHTENNRIHHHRIKVEITYQVYEKLKKHKLVNDRIYKNLKRMDKYTLKKIDYT